MSNKVTCPWCKLSIALDNKISVHREPVCSMYSNTVSQAAANSEPLADGTPREVIYSGSGVIAYIP